MDLKPTFEHYYPEGTNGGECVVFAENLYAFGPTDSLYPKVSRYQSKFAYLKAHGSTNLSDIKVGDIIVGDDNPTDGHIWIVNCDMGNAWRASESNYNGDQKVHHTRLVLKTSPHIKGHIRAPIKVAVINPTPMIKNVLVLLSKVPVDIEGYTRKGIQRYCDKVASRTNNEFQIVTTYAYTDATFHTVHATSTDGTDTIFADPTEIGMEGAKVEQATGKEFDSVCLVYNPAFIIGDHPNHPVDSPTTIAGFNPFSIPTDWIGNVPGGPTFDWEGSAYSAQFFFGHENSHSDYYIVNSEGGLALRDKTHDLNPYSQSTATTDPSDFYIDLLFELKPYWQFLGQPISGKVPMLLYKFDDNPTVYALADDATLIGITATGLPKTLKGRPQKLVVIPATQRPNFVIADSAIN